MSPGGRTEPPPAVAGGDYRFLGGTMGVPPNPRVSPGATVRRWSTQGVPRLDRDVKGWDGAGDLGHAAISCADHPPCQHRGRCLARPEPPGGIEPTHYSL